MEKDVLIYSEDILSLRLLKKGKLANGWYLCYDVAGNVYYMSPEAYASSKIEWKWFTVHGETFIYIEEY